MKKLFSIATATSLLLFFTVFLSFPQVVLAADVRTGDTITLAETQQDLKDLYLFGKTIQLNAPVTNDVVIGGSDIVINGDISNDLIAGGSTITMRGNIGNTARIAGGTIMIDGPIANDLVVSGGTVVVGEHATIGGDILFAGSKLTVNGPVHGKILMTGKEITLNNTVDGDVTGGDIEQLTLGSQAKINGNLSYASDTKAQQAAGSVISGKNEMHQSEKHQENDIASFAKASAYKLVIDIILSVLFIYFFRQGLLTLIARMEKAPLKNGGIGFAYVILAPLASLIGLILVWLGMASFLSYALILLISIFVIKVFLGLLIIRWWYARQKQSYPLDWKAGVVGPIALFLLILIPVLGWIATALLFFVAVGAFVKELLNLVPKLQGETKEK